MNTQHYPILNADLKNFLILSQHQSISSAARKTGQDPGNLSRFLARLEKDFGYQLFVRHKTGLVLTENGKKLEQSLISAQKEFERQQQESIQQHIKIGFSQAIGFGYFSRPLVGSLQRLNLTPHFTLASSIELIERLKKRELDFVLAPRAPQFPGLITKSIATDNLVLCSNSGKMQKTLLVNSQMFNLEKILRHLNYEKRWSVDDYFVLAKLVEDNADQMGLIPESLLSHYRRLQRVEVYKEEGRITAITWPGSVGVKVMSAMKRNLRTA